MSIIWVRHGETALNAARVVQPSDTPLSDIGLKQAAAAAIHLQSLQPVALISSDMPRARQTAEAISHATGLAIRTDERLRERNFGALCGKPWDELGFEVSSLQAAPDGGESLTAFHDRVAQAWQAVLALRTTLSGPLVVVSHGLLIRAALQLHAHWPPGLTLPDRLRNTSYSLVAAVAPYSVLAVDRTDHLSSRGTDTMRPC
jgi:broad specificity phosphatase PhoE